MPSSTPTAPPSHAVVTGSPGVRPRLAGLVMTVWPLFLATLAAGYLIRAAFPFPRLSPTSVGILCLCLAAALAAGVAYARGRLNSFLKGARGEELVARRLSFLPGEYHVFHGLEVGGGDLDHVVLGPGGVHMIETKNWSGTVSLSGDRILCNGTAPTRNPIDQVTAAAALLEARLAKSCRQPIGVKPVLCFARSRMDGGHAFVGNVIVTDLAGLLGVIRAESGTPVTTGTSEQAERSLELLAQQSGMVPEPADESGSIQLDRRTAAETGGGS